MGKRWKKQEIDYLFENIDKQSMPELCNHLGRNERSIRLFLHRHQNDPRIVQKDNLLIRILTIQFKDPALFTPNRSFLDKVKIGQKRFWMIYKGKAIMTDEEYKRVADFFGIPYDSIQEIRQTELFTNN